MKIKPLYTRYYFEHILKTMAATNELFLEKDGTLWHADDVREILKSI